jgi:hypothetical protein
MSFGSWTIQSNKIDSIWEAGKPELNWLRYSGVESQNGTESTWQIFERLGGPLNLRLILQPTIAAIFGYLDGAKDARAGAPPYFWSVATGLVEERRA